eukprot:3727633-Rhodomonas_salina.3
MPVLTERAVRPAELEAILAEFSIDQPGYAIATDLHRQVPLDTCTASIMFSTHDGAGDHDSKRDDYHTGAREQLRAAQRVSRVILMTTSVGKREWFGADGVLVGVGPEDL